MFELTIKEARVELRDHSEFDVLLQGMVASGYSAVIKEMERAAANAVGLTPKHISLTEMLSERRFMRHERGDFSKGEVFAKDRSLYFLFQEGKRLTAMELKRHEDPPGLDTLTIAVEQAIRTRIDGRRVRGMDFTWRDQRPMQRGPRRTQVLTPLATKNAEFTEIQLLQAEKFATSEYRSFLLNLAKVGNKARTADAAGLLDEVSRTQLIDSGLIRKEYLLICKQDSRTICSIPDKEKLETTIGSELTCTSCGRTFNNELVQDIYALTSDARRLLTGSHWMTIWITNYLVTSGVPMEHIKWNAASGDDELDIIADIQGLRVFLELKDREFGLGDAYPFSFRVERYGGDVGLVVTTASVAEEAQKFLTEQRQRGSISINTIEGEQQIRQELPKLVDSLSQLSVRRALMRSTDRLGIDIWPLVEAWMRK